MNHPAAEEIERYVNRTATPAQIGAVLDHAAECPACRERLCGGKDQMRNLLGAFGSVLDISSQSPVEPCHLSEETLAAFVSGDLDDVDLEIASGHVEDCEQCRNELAALRAPNRRLALPFPDDRTKTAKHIGRRPALLLTVPSSRLGLVASWVVILALCAAVLVQRRQISGLRAAMGAIREIESSLATERASVSQLRADLDGMRRLNDASSNPTQVAVSLNDGGGIVSVDNEGNLLGLQGLPVPYENLVKAALLRRRIEVPRGLRALLGKREVLMGPGQELSPFPLLSPLATVVKDQKPTFRWKALAGATRYVLTISDSDLNEVAISPKLAATEWTLPQRLRRGATYYWQVAAMKGEKEEISPAPSAPRAEFKVLGAKQLDDLGKAESTYHGSHLVLAVLYGDAGLLDDAQRELAALEKANPNSPVARQLLRSVRRTR